MSKKQKGLDGEDRNLWTHVARSTIPLTREQRNLESDLANFLDGEDTPPPAPPVFRKIKPSPVPTTVHHEQPPLNLISHPIDDPTARKLAKGRQKIDGRIDLHGMTQNRARAALLDFLTLARAAEYRIVLVITGKGNMGTGILKQRVPDWLSTPPFASLVNGYRQSHVSHGGEGALYVRVRRSKRARAR